VRVAHTLQRVDGKLQLLETKTERSRRTVPVPRFAIEALRQHKLLQLKEKLIAGSRWKETGLVFTTTIGTPLEGRRLREDFKTLLQRAGLPHMRFHDLRHSCASLLLAQGLSPRLIMETLGHSQISTTMNTYAHVMPSLLQEVANAMDKVFNN